MSTPLCIVGCGPYDGWLRWDRWELLSCPKCRTQTVAPIPSTSDLEEFYQGFNRRAQDRPDERLLLVETAVDHYLERITHHRSVPPRQALDLGGGVGYYSRALMNRDVRTWLMDYEQEALAFARDRLGVDRVTRGNIQDCHEFFDERFDFVLARHCIEHMTDPSAFLQHVREVLEPGGILQLETPDVTSNEQWAHPMVMVANYRILARSNPDHGRVRLATTAMKKSMSGVNPPKHLWGFTPQSLRLLLAAHGFEVLEVRREVAGHPVFDPLYWELNGRRTRRGMGIAYYGFERAAGLLFRGRGMNLAVTARRRAS